MTISSAADIATQLLEVSFDQIIPLKIIRTQNTFYAKYVSTLRLFVVKNQSYLSPKKKL
jgi:hypothetical protein